MEIFELRYFLAVARSENIHRASEKISVSPASLSKAIARLEYELHTKLFRRDGRNIKLTDSGRLLKTHAAQILSLEEAAKSEVMGHQSQIHAILSGPEVLLSKFGIETIKSLAKRYPKISFELHGCDEDSALREVSHGEAHLAFVTQIPPKSLTAKKCAETKFATVVGMRHPLYERAKSKKIVTVEEVLEYDFASPDRPFLGQVQRQQSLDGWRDDAFPRKIKYRISSLKLLEEVVAQGLAIAYLPDYLIEAWGSAHSVEILKVSGCPYICTQNVKLAALRPKESGWMQALF